MSENNLEQRIIDFFKTYQYLSLITIDESGTPKARMMDNLPFSDDMVCWFGTYIGSNKVSEIRNNPKASAFLYRPNDHSSVCLQGMAEVITDSELRKEKWDERWIKYFPDGPTSDAFALIKIAPNRIIYLDWPNNKQEILDL